MKAILTLVMALCSSLAFADESKLYIVDRPNGLPTIAMHSISGSRLVTKKDLESVTKATIEWNSHEAKELRRLERFSNLEEIHIGWGNLKFPDLKYLDRLKLNALFVGHTCQAYPRYVKVLENFPQLERLGFDFGFDSIAQTMKSVELKELEVLRGLAKLKELRIAGHGVTSLATPRLSNHPNLETLYIGVSSVGVRGKLTLEGLPKLKSLRFPRINDENVPALLGLDGLESLSGDAKDLSLEGFELLAGLPRLKYLNLKGFWTPENQLACLKSLRRYTADELKTVHLVNALQQAAEYERDYENAKRRLLVYGPMMSGTADERARKPWKRQIHQLVRKAVGENHTGTDAKRALAKAALQLAATSSRKDFYRNTHRAVERFSKLKFSEISVESKSTKSGQQMIAKGKTTVNSIGMEFQQIPAGSFGFKDDKSGKQVKVEVTHSFQLGIHEVTQGQFNRILGRNPCVETDRRYPQLIPLGKDLPVSKIRIYDALEFCSKLSKLPAEKKSGRSYRLPAEIEWELACRAGTSSQFSFGEAGDFSPKVANLSPNKDFPHGFVGTKKVGSFPPNGFGLYDMHGNVTELCIDRRSKFNPTSPDFVNFGSKLGNHVFRGGDYSTFSDDAGSSYRSRHQEYYGDVTISQLGFRIVCVSEKASPLSQRILDYQNNMASK